MQTRKNANQRESGGKGRLREFGGMWELPPEHKTERTKWQFLSIGECEAVKKSEGLRVNQTRGKLILVCFSVFQLHFYSFLFFAELAVVTNFATVLLLFFRLF